MLYLTTHSTHFIYGVCGRKEMFYLTTHSTHFILRLYGVRYMEGNVLFNDALNTFYFTVIWRQTYGRKEIFNFMTHSTHFILRLYGIRHMVKDHSASEKGNPLPPHRLLSPINIKGSFICTIPQTG